MRNIPAFQGKRKLMNGRKMHSDGAGVGPSRYLASGSLDRGSRRARFLRRYPSYLRRSCRHPSIAIIHHRFVASQ
eukprot:scaffold2429_cov154-Skeletonema_marinoi.AAC.4